MKYIALCLFLLMQSLYTQAAQLRAVTEHFPPFSFKTDQGHHGFSVEFFRYVADELKMELDLQLIPWARAYHIASTQPDTLIFSLARTTEREQQFIWLEPFATNQVSLFARKSANIQSLRHWSEAQHYRVGVIRDSATAHKFSSIAAFSTSNNLVEVENISQLIGLLKRNRVDVISLSETMLHQLNEEDVQALQHLLTFDELVFYGAFHPQSDPKLVQQVSAAMKTFLQTREYTALVARYFPNKSTIYATTQR